VASDKAHSLERYAENFCISRISARSDFASACQHFGFLVSFFAECAIRARYPWEAL
jgi:hypothetical protein